MQGSVLVVSRTVDTNLHMNGGCKSVCFSGLLYDVTVIEPKRIFLCCVCVVCVCVCVCVCVACARVCARVCVCVCTVN